MSYHPASPSHSGCLTPPDLLSPLLQPLLRSWKAEVDTTRWCPAWGQACPPVGFACAQSTQLARTVAPCTPDSILPAQPSLINAQFQSSSFWGLNCVPFLHPYQCLSQLPRDMPPSVSDCCHLSSLRRPHTLRGRVRVTLSPHIPSCCRCPLPPGIQGPRPFGSDAWETVTGPEY